ncbi:glycosyltransferase family 4 protein [Bacillus alveayuensis]|uniref:glycosyltransferase family 4 protein n=1 Tax=Aeribacillus alveayuensis TaxID=279215 RepID=UPI0005CD2548|nr:glycosyltransferase family 4 protein [Bacillus alveayuensis]
MPNIRLITNMCTHYRVKLFEYLNEKLDIDFIFFSEGNEIYWNKKIPLQKGNFKNISLKGINIGKKLRIVPSLISILLFDDSKVIIKCINGRFALPVTFLISKLRKKKFILWTGMWKHPDTIFHKLSFPLTKLIYKYSDAIVVYGTHVKDYLISLGVEPEKIFIGWQTIDNNKFNKLVDNETISLVRKKLKVDSHEKIVLTIARLVEEKGIQYLIEAIHQLENEKLHLVVIGNGPLERGLLQLSKDLSVKLTILNYVPNDEIINYIAACDLFVLPSVTTKTFKEPWGLVVNEVMNQSKPIVVTDAVGAGVGGLIDNNKNGIVVPERNSYELSRAIFKIITDENFAKMLGENAKKTIEGWTYDRMGNQFIEAIKYVSSD